MSTTETRSMNYESFMNGAYRIDRRIKRPTKAEFQNLVRKENEGANIKEILKNLRIECKKLARYF